MREVIWLAYIVPFTVAAPHFFDGDFFRVVVVAVVFHVVGGDVGKEFVFGDGVVAGGWEPGEAGGFENAAASSCFDGCGAALLELWVGCGPFGKREVGGGNEKDEDG